MDLEQVEEQVNNCIGQRSQQAGNQRSKTSSVKDLEEAKQPDESPSDLSKGQYKFDCEVPDDQLADGSDQIDSSQIGTTTPKQMQACNKKMFKQIIKHM